MAPTPPTKQQLLADLERSRDEVIARVSVLDDAALERGVYENGWNAKQILAHIASIEWTYPRLIEMARDIASGTQKPTAPPSARAAPAAPPATTAPSASTVAPQAPILDYNERQVAKRAEASIGALLDEFSRNRTTLVVAIEGTDDETLRTELRSAGGVQGPLASVIRLLAVDHVAGHVRDMTGTGG
jgi:hypothetical protein